jgi:hypothetical protein
MEPEPEKPIGGWIILLILPFIALLWVPFYNFKEPVIAGFPFFYSYQFVWVILTAGLTYVVYRRPR